MERITSRKNEKIQQLRRLASDGDYRRARGLYLCDGMKTLREALRFGARIDVVLWREKAQELEGLSCGEQFEAPADLFDYASPMVNSPGPLFAVEIAQHGEPDRWENALVLENVQDPGNVGTVIRTANALGIEAVILCGDCADLYHPKTVRATMGAIFRQKVLTMEPEQLRPFLDERGLALYGAALSDEAREVRTLSLKNCAVAVGSEGRGLSRELLASCEGKVIIPMQPNSESLNAAVAAGILMWEMVR